MSVSIAQLADIFLVGGKILRANKRTMLIALVIVIVCVFILAWCQSKNNVSYTAMRALDGAFALATGHASSDATSARVERKVTPFMKNSRPQKAFGVALVADCRLMLVSK